MKATRSLGYGVAALLVVAVLLVVYKEDPARRSSPGTKLSTPANAAAQAEPATVATASSQSPVPRPVQSSGVSAAGGGSADRVVDVINGQKVAYSGAFARASVTASGKTYELTPNQMGYFGRVDVAPKSVSRVSIAFPQGNPGDVVNVVVEDGGHLNKDQMAEAATLDDAKTVAFDFTTTDQAGIYRIALRDGADVKVLNFWVGQEPQLRN